MQHGSTEPSRVLTAIGVDADTAHSALRLSLGQSNTEAGVEHLAGVVPEIVGRLEALAPA